MKNELMINLLKNYDPKQATFRPTEIYNENWLIKILLNEYKLNGIKDGPLAFTDGAEWFSEAMLPTKFRARHQGDKLAESRTNADAVIGYFDVGNIGKADIELLQGAKQFVVVEAKINSELSKRVTNKPGYDQAARNVACMAEMLHLAKINPNNLDKMAFVVIAPQNRIDDKIFSKEMNKDSILKKVKNRVFDYKNDEDNKYQKWLNNWFVPTLNQMKIIELSWESAIDELISSDIKTQQKLLEFYKECLEYN